MVVVGARPYVRTCPRPLLIVHQGACHSEADLPSGYACPANDVDGDGKTCVHHSYHVNDVDGGGETYVHRCSLHHDETYDDVCLPANGGGFENVHAHARPYDAARTAVEGSHYAPFDFQDAEPRCL